MNALLVRARFVFAARWLVAWWVFLGLTVAWLGGGASPAHAGTDEGSCVRCHEAESDEELSAPVVEWRESVHAAVWVSCDSCHGGDPRVDDADDAKADGTGFLDHPAWNEEAEYCGMCHEEVAAAFAQGQLGSKQAEGVRVATCLACHMTDGHRIASARPEDLASSRACARCEPIPGIEAAIAAGAGIHERVVELERAIAGIEAQGISLHDLRTELADQRRRLSLDVHGFDSVASGSGPAAVLASLDDIGARVGHHESRVRRHRAAGPWMLAVLGMALIGLGAIWRRLP